MKGAKDRHKELVEREVDLLQQVEAKKNPNIVTFKETFTKGDDPCVVMEYCDGGTLYEKIRDLKKQNKTMCEEEFIDTLQQIVNGVEVCL